MKTIKIISNEEVSIECNWKGTRKEANYLIDLIMQYADIKGIVLTEIKDKNI